ncbi:hypothetical protein OEZ85_002254 [Tetradesmus obliquus]|uniref:Glycosyltransferase family 92 protein n=1 Tax=Tetradesmus obliquus TaxID=3088 RepID=A0ABY8U308_TETOB|nr:hypothetical protein OEZ85_002254 [Tetradesmus obliquus]
MVGLQLLLVLHAVLSAASPGHHRAPMRHALNVQGCPEHKHPYTTKQFAHLVSMAPFLQPGAADGASLDAGQLSRQVASFTFDASAFVTEYVSRIGPINGQRPHTLTLECSKPKFSSILSGTKRQQPAKIVWASRFSFESYLLVFRLHTYKDLVDNFFTSESSRLAYTGTPKPLIYESVKHHFLDFMENITHHVLDDTTWRKQFSWRTGTTTTATGVVWDNELRHHQAIYRELPKQFAGWADSDLVVYGDMDEMADEDFLLHLKHCELKPGLQEPIHSNIVYWHADYRYMFRSDWPPSGGYPYSLRFPTVWTLGTVRKGNPQNPGEPLELRNYRSAGFHPTEPGGWHLGYTLFAPALYLKYIGVAEIGVSRIAKFPNISDVHRHLAAQRSVSPLIPGRETWRKRIPHPDCVLRQNPVYKNVTLQVPWLVAQNMQAFAFWTPCEPAFYDLDPAAAECI